jgi:hypothetical protein
MAILLCGAWFLIGMAVGLGMGMYYSDRRDWRDG